jgi:hypothetical protein
MYTKLDNARNVAGGGRKITNYKSQITNKGVSFGQILNACGGGRKEKQVKTGRGKKIALMDFIGSKHLWPIKYLTPYPAYPYLSKPPIFLKNISLNYWSSKILSTASFFSHTLAISSISRISTGRLHRVKLISGAVMRLCLMSGGICL